MVSMAKGFLLFDVILSLSLISLYLPVIIQGILSLNITLSHLQNYHQNLIRLQAHINDHSIGFEPLSQQTTSGDIVIYVTEEFGLPIRWANYTP